jgi:hypothetical protein
MMYATGVRQDVRKRSNERPTTRRSIEWKRGQRGDSWRASVDGRRVAVVRRAGANWTVRWQVAGIDQTTLPASWPLRETAVAVVEARVRGLLTHRGLEEKPDVMQCVRALAARRQ